MDIFDEPSRYALCYLLMVNGLTVTLQSYLASIQELFPTGGERAIAVVRQTPFLVLTYILGGALPYVIAFGSTPDTEGQCCVTPQYDCSLAPPCGCFNGTATASELRVPLDVFHPTFAAVCGNGSLSPSASAASMIQHRDSVCSEPGVPYQCFAAMATLTLVMGTTAWFAVAPARRGGIKPGGDGGSAVHIHTKPVGDSLASAMAMTFRQRAFQTYAASMIPRDRVGLLFMYSVHAPAPFHI